jgi:hypothetical protein
MVRAGELYDELRSNLIRYVHLHDMLNGNYLKCALSNRLVVLLAFCRNIVRNYQETGFFWENYDQNNKGNGKGARSFTGWTSLVVLIMSESYPTLHR